MEPPTSQHQYHYHVPTHYRYGISPNSRSYTCATSTPASNSVPRIALPPVPNSFTPSMSPSSPKSPSSLGSSPRSSTARTSRSSPSLRSPVNSGNDFGDNAQIYQSPRRQPLGIDVNYLLPEQYEQHPSSTSLQTIDFAWEEELRRSTSEKPKKSYHELELEFSKIFDSRDHRIPSLPHDWWETSMEVAGVYPGHILFVERQEKKRRVQVYHIVTGSIELIDVKYDSAGLSIDGKFLIVLYGGTIYLYSVDTHKSVKKHKLKNVHVRKWTSNARAFCWVDSEGRFWKWALYSSDEPEVIFKLQSNAPRHWLTPLASADGSWYAIVATDERRRRGVVHCHPDDHGETRVFDGPCAASFSPMATPDGKNTVAVVLMSVGQAGRCGDVTLDIQGLARSAKLDRTGPPKSIRLSPSMQLLPELHFDPKSSLIIAAASTMSTDGSMLLIFDPLSASLVTTRHIDMDQGDRISSGSCGLHKEQRSSIFQRLVLHPEGLPRPDSAGTGAAPFAGSRVVLAKPSRSSFETWFSDSADGSSHGDPRASTFKGTPSIYSRSGSKPTTPAVNKVNAFSYGMALSRGFVNAPAEDESWIWERRR